MIRLRALRLEHGITAVELAAYVGVSRNNVFHWEGGRIPRRNHREKVAEFFRERGIIGVEDSPLSLYEQAPETEDDQTLDLLADLEEPEPERTIAAASG